MSSDAPDSRSSLLAVAVLAAGSLLFFYPTIFSGFARAQVDTLDSRLINHILEHGWLWLRGDPAHAELWSPPVFWPAGNTAAYSETLLGVAPLYWCWRMVGIAPDTAYQLWLISLSALNYGAALFVLRRDLDVGATASIAGAALIAFGSPRLQQLIHAQLLPVFFVLLALSAVRRMLDRPDGAGRYVVLFAACAVTQLYASFYVGWFLILGLGVAVLFALPSRPARRRLGALVAQQWKWLLTTTVAAALLTLPMLQHYLEAARARGYRQFTDVVPMLPRPQSWLYMGPANWLYGGLGELPLFAELPMDHEHRLGVGLVTAAAAVAGLLAHRRSAWVRYLAGPVLVVCVLATLWPWGSTAWRLVFDTVPGGAAIRAVSRVGLFALLPLGLGLAWTVEHLVKRGYGRWAVALIGLCVLEQGTGLDSFDKATSRARADAIAARVPAGSAAFLYLPAAGEYWSSQVDAMWASVATGTPTVNGYSGNIPPGFPFSEQVVASGGEALRAAMRDWAARHGFDPGAVAIIDDR